MSEVKKSGHSHHQRGRFSGKIGYVLAVAGSAVGLGNIWRFPYLAAKYGGGMFLLVYILLTVSFGYVLIMSETALGRMTRKSPGIVKPGKKSAMTAREILNKFQEYSGATICKDLKGKDTGVVLCECDDCIRNAIRAFDEVLPMESESEG